jgi:hypothetical protein
VEELLCLDTSSPWKKLVEQVHACVENHCVLSGILTEYVHGVLLLFSGHVGNA